MKSKKPKRNIKPRVIVYSLIGFVFIALTFLIDWIFILGAIIMMWLNQRELNKK
ncbi:MAG: hypothetical protein ACOCUU_01690 [Nanoarchaeota archaeon]